MIGEVKSNACHGLLKQHKSKPKKIKPTPLTYQEKVSSYQTYCTLHYGNRPLNLFERRALERDMGTCYKELLYLQAKPPELRPANAMKMVFDNDSTDTSSDLELGIDNLHSALHSSGPLGDFVPMRHDVNALLRPTGIRPDPHTNTDSNDKQTVHGFPGSSG